MKLTFSKGHDGMFQTFTKRSKKIFLPGNFSPKNSQGFTMIELLISISIFTLLSAMVLVKYNSFNIKAEFSNAVEEVVLALRQAQVYGVASKSSTDSGGAIIRCPAVTGSPFDCVYGVHFSSNIGENDKVTIFVDENANYVYDVGETIAETIRFRSPIRVFGLKCGGGDCAGDRMNITFRRPNPDAFIADVSPTIPISYSSGSVTLTNGEIFSTATTTLAGQISLQ